MRTSPPIAFCVHSRNRLPFLLPCIDSILAQTMREFELVIVDYGSSDGTPDQIRARYMDERINLVTYDDRHQPWSRAVAKNRAAMHATSPIIIIADCDNLFEPDFLQTHYALYQEDTESFYFGGANKLRSDGYVPYGLTMCWREDFIRAGGFNEFCSYGWGREDVDLIGRLMQLNRQCKKFLPMVTDQKHEDSLRNQAEVVSSLEVTNNLNFIASQIGLLDCQGKTRFSERLLAALSAYYASNPPVKPVGFDSIQLLYSDYSYKKIYLEQNTCCLLYTVRVEYELANELRSDTFSAFSRVHLYAGGKEKQDSSDYLSFDALFNLTHPQPGQETDYVRFLHQLHRSVIEPYFKRTLCLAETQFPDLLDTYWEQCPLLQDPCRTAEAFHHFLQTQLDTPPDQAVLRDIFSLETTLLQVRQTIPPQDEVAIKESKEALLALEEEDWLEVTLQLSPEVAFCLTQWDWSATTTKEWEMNLQREPSPTITLMIAYPFFTHEQVIPEPVYQLLLAFRKPQPVRIAVARAMGLSSVYQGEFIHPVVKDILQQLKTAFAAHILIETVSHSDRRQLVG